MPVDQVLRHNCQKSGDNTVDLLANRNILLRFLGIFVYAKNEINVLIWQLMLRHVLTDSLKLIAFVLNN